MGQYHKFVNFTKKEFVNPHVLGNGLKLLEQIGWDYAFSHSMHFLLAKCDGRGGGDYHNKSELVGSWGGDRVSLVGDYAEREDFPFLSDEEYNEMMNSVWKEGLSDYKDISNDVAKEMEEIFEIEYTGDGWRDIKPKTVPITRGVSKS